MVHAMITQVLLGWCATAAGQTRSEVIERLALTSTPGSTSPGHLNSAVKALTNAFALVTKRHG
jgi:hypothetical protein